jgi:uncharacterized membrane protein YeaQ/YmgE (transglycosylase-associated protein family)
MGILTWIILGALSGWIVSLIVKTNGQQGMVGNIVIGVVGAVIGGFVGSKLFGLNVSGLNITSILLAVGGGLIFTFILNAVIGKKSL